MQIPKTVFLFFFLFWYNAASLWAQQGTSISGGEGSGTGGKVSYTLGEVHYQLITSNGGSISQGLQHSYEFLISTGIERTDIHLNTSVYPNPTMDFVVLSLQASVFQNMSYALFDMQGKLVARQVLSNNPTYIPMAEFANASYFLKVLDGNKEVKIFKIIKNQ